MDFFTTQDQARRNTGRLVLFFVLAVLSLIVLTNLLVMLTFGFFHISSQIPGADTSFNWPVFFGVGGIVLLIVACGSLYKMNKLSSGGDAVAAMFGATQIFRDNPDLDHQRLIHVVEEMAIASGTPIPQVYILNENGINAFAAGFTTSDAIIAVTKGAVRTLNREQLQGVIAHEFSHILNGDMRLNIRLVGILHGILLIGLIGSQILRGSGRSERKEGGRWLLLALGLIAIGYTGTFFGKLIKAAVSRQREFLADGAAVQFTRNPDGIGGALLQIGAHQGGSLMSHPKSEEISHAMFGEGQTVTFQSLFATHPPLAERIRRILPGWDGTFPQAKTLQASQPPPVLSPEAAMEKTAGLTGTAVVNQVGRPDNSHLFKARQLRKSIDEPFRQVGKDPFSAQAMLLYLVLDQEEKIRTAQLTQLKTSSSHGVYPELRRLLHTSATVQGQHRLPLIELCLPALRLLTEEQSRLFLADLKAIIRADGRITLFEWCLYAIVSKYLREYFERPSAEAGSHIDDLRQVKKECGVVLSMLIHSIRHEGLKDSDVFANALREMELSEIKQIPAEQINLTQMNQSLKVLRRLKPQAKARLLKGCVACVLADNKIEPVEAELLRAVAATLSIPMPPL